MFGQRTNPKHNTTAQQTINAGDTAHTMTPTGRIPFGEHMKQSTPANLADPVNTNGLFSTSQHRTQVKKVHRSDNGAGVSLMQPGDVNTVTDYPAAYSRDRQIRSNLLDYQLNTLNVAKISKISGTVNTEPFNNAAAAAAVDDERDNSEHPEMPSRKKRRLKDGPSQLEADHGSPAAPLRTGGVTMPRISTSELGSNLLEIQHRVDHCYENQCLKTISEQNPVLLERMRKTLDEGETRRKQFTGSVPTIYNTLFDTYGNKLENKLRALVDLGSVNDCRTPDSVAAGSHLPNFPVREMHVESPDTQEYEVQHKMEQLYLKLLKSNAIVTIKRKHIVTEFLRPALRVCGERECINGVNCTSILQYHQLWLKDPVLFKQTWGLSVDSASGNILNSNGHVFKPFALREFLCPDEEKARLTNFKHEMAHYLNTTAENELSGNIDADTRLEKWFSETTARVNPQIHGYCILCLLIMCSELTTIFNGASVVSNPNICVLIQHHCNIFGVPGEYKSGCEIRRGSNICGLIGPVLEYRVDNYLPQHTIVTCNTIIVRPNTTTDSVGGLRRNLSNAVYALGELKIPVLRWVEIDAIVCKTTDMYRSTPTGT